MRGVSKKSKDRVAETRRVLDEIMEKANRAIDDGGSFDTDVAR
jgi:hypothetical protein